MSQPNCKVCQHSKVEQINLALKAGVEITEICQTFGGFSENTLLRHRKHTPGLEDYGYVNGALQQIERVSQSLTDVNLDSEQVRLLVLQKLLSACERAEAIASTTNSLKAEQILGDLLCKADKLLSTLEYSSTQRSD